ncbi:MAG: class I fructose-bisphosphate aldolase [Anaerolineales bacterium]
MYNTRRMNRIFKPDGRTLIVAMDHVGFMNKPMDALMDAGPTIAECVSGGADAIMTTLATAETCAKDVGDAGLILTIPSAAQPATDKAVETALRLGADAVKVLVYPFQANPEPTILAQIRLSHDCYEWGMPLLSEPIPGGWTAGDDMRTPEAIAAGARVAAEAGADFVKTLPTADPADFQMVADNCPVPVVVLGGAKADDDRSLLQSVKDAVDNGAAGVAMGRNVFSHEKPGAVVAALAAIIHDDASVDEAMKELG